MRIANLLVKKLLCHILSWRFGGALQRQASAYSFYKTFVILIRQGAISPLFTGI
jgi:hypothetical protein